MTIGAVGAGSAAGRGSIGEVEVQTVATEDGLAMLIGELSARLDESQKGTREARRASLEVQQSEQRQQIASLREKAAMTMYAGIVEGSVTMASAAVKGAGVAASASAATPSQGGVDPGFSAVSQGIEGGGKIAGGVLERIAIERDAAATSHDQVANRAAGTAQEQGEDADRLQRLQEQALQHASAILDATRQAEQAALRA